MSNFTLVDGFWHPKLGLVLAYMWRYDGGVRHLPSGREVDLNVRERKYIVLDYVTEEAALYALECARQLEDDEA